MAKDKRVKNLKGMEQLILDIKPNRSVSDVYINQKMDLTNLVKYVDKRKKDGESITYFYAFLAAIGKVLYNRPKLNRYIRNRHVFEHANIVISFVAKVSFDDKSEEIMVMVPIEEKDNIYTISKKVSDKVIAITSKIGEKISFRRFEIIEKADDEVFGTYSHMGGKISVVVLLKGSNEEVAKDVAMHACAMRPSYINPEDIPEDVLSKERNIIKEQSMNEGKPAEIAEKMVEGRIKKYYKEVCLNEQAFIKDANLSVKAYASNAGCSVVSMTRYEVGEGMQKREENFAEEVANQING